MDIEKRPQNGVFLIENWHLTDRLVYKSIFQTIIFLLPYVFVRLAIKPHIVSDTNQARRSYMLDLLESVRHDYVHGGYT